MAASGVELFPRGRGREDASGEGEGESSVEVFAIRQDSLSVSQIVRYGLEEIPGLLE